MLSALTIETFLLARYAESGADGTLNVLGGGITMLVKPPAQPVGQLCVGATLLAAGDRAEWPVWCRVFNPAGERMLELGMTANVSDGPGTRRIPIAFTISGQFETYGEWRVELSTGDDLRVARLELVPGL
jgi:hypothetical protein